MVPIDPRLLEDALVVTDDRCDTTAAARPVPPNVTAAGSA
jgi:hypothetical protein